MFVFLKVNVNTFKTLKPLTMVNAYKNKFCLVVFKNCWNLRFLKHINKAILFVLKYFICVDISSTYPAPSQNSTDRGTYYQPPSPLHLTLMITTITWLFGYVHNIVFELVNIVNFYDLPREHSFYPFWTFSLFPIDFMAGFLYIFSDCVVCSLVL